MSVVEYPSTMYGLLVSGCKDLSPEKDGLACCLADSPSLQSSRSARLGLYTESEGIHTLASCPASQRMASASESIESDFFHKSWRLRLLIRGSYNVSFPPPGGRWAILPISPISKGFVAFAGACGKVFRRITSRQD